MVNTIDPAHDPNREILGSKTLGSVATGFDSFAIELSKLGNGALQSLAVLGGRKDLSDYFGANVRFLGGFQDELLKAHPVAGQIGKIGAMADAAILTTPIWGKSIPKALATGYLGAASSAVADVGSNKEAPTKEDVMKGLVGWAPVSAVLGAKVGRYFNLKDQPIASRTTEAAVEAVSPETATSAADSFKNYIMNRE